MLNVKLVRQKMKEMNISNKKLAEVLGVHYGTISNWFCYFRVPTLSHVIAICKILDLNIDDVVVGIAE